MPTPPRKTKTQKSDTEAVKPLDEHHLRDQIGKRAHEIWLSSGCGHGNDIAHWLQAENEVLAERQKNPNQTI